MFGVFALMCVLENKAVCREVMLPTYAENLAACQAKAATIAKGWVQKHPQKLSLRQVRCARLEHAYFTAEEIADGVYAHIGEIALPTPDNKGDLANISFVIGDHAVAVIDSGGSRAVGEAAYRALRQITQLPVRYVILGHMHPDHVYGATVFQEVGAQIVAHEKFKASLQARAGNFAQSMDRVMGGRAFLGSAPPVPDIEIGGVTELDLGGRILRLEAFGTAHTDNDLVVFDVKTATLFTSDLVFLEHTPALDGSLRGWQSALDRLSTIKAARVVPGHGPVSDWPGAITPIQNYLDSLAVETESHLAAGKSLSVSAPTIAQSQADNWQLFEEYNIRNATAAYAELEWE